MNTKNAAEVLLRRNLELQPDKTAYFCGGRELSYRDLARRSLGFVILLKKERIAPGERVLIALPDSLAFPVVFLGCLMHGAVAVTVGDALRGAELAHVIGECGVRLLVIGGESELPLSAGFDIKVIEIGDDSLPAWSGVGDPFDGIYRPAADDIAYMLYSSGTTGRPKGVPHRHKSLILPCDLVGRGVLGIRSDDIILSTSKFSFTYGLINSLAFPLFFGASAILHSGKPDPEAILDIIGRRRPSVFFSVPSIYTMIALSCAGGRLDLPMRLCCSAGEVLPAPLFHEWQRLTGLEIVDGIGCTEMSYHYICNVPGRAVPGSAGRLVPGYRVRLVDEKGDDVPAGSEGILLVAGETMSPSYWNQADESAGTMGADGFLKTRDLFVEREGFYYHRGRSDDMIKVDALWVSPALVEEALRRHPAVADCAVAAVSVGTLLRPGAFIVLNPGTEQTPELVAELRAHMAALLPGHMRPVRYRFLGELPRTATGKLQRFRLRETD